MRRGDAFQGVDEILQADVMRFLAIIAICLMAILALVRGAEPIEAAQAPQPVPPAEPQVTVRPQAPPQPEPAPVVEAPAAEPSPVRAPGREVAGARQPAAEPVFEPRAERLPVPPPEPEVAERVPLPEPATEPVPPDPAPDSEPEGLSLRFASDQDFLRLVNRGDVRLFAFREGEVLAVGAGLELAPSRAPGELHELLPETIPTAMAAALRSRAGAGEFRWGVVMPERIARAIRGYVERGAAGQLVIDRFGEVRHHEA